MHGRIIYELAWAEYQPAGVTSCIFTPNGEWKPAKGAPAPRDP
jgi:hypothetical protein